MSSEHTPDCRLLPAQLTTTLLVVCSTSTQEADRNTASVYLRSILSRENSSWGKLTPEEQAHGACQFPQPTTPAVATPSPP